MGKGFTIRDLMDMKAEIAFHRDAARLNRELRIIEHGGIELLDFLTNQPNGED